MKVKVGISNRHVHLTKEDYKILFNKETLTLRNNLTQPEQFAACETVAIKTEKNIINNVRIIGPFRSYSQVEISKTDARTLGINPPIRDSGDLSDASNITILGPCGQIRKKCCIIATRHIHISKEEKEKYNLNDKVKIKINSEKPTILEEVSLKVGENYNFELHLDTDDANAAFISQGQEVEIIF